MWHDALDLDRFIKKMSAFVYDVLGFKPRTFDACAEKLDGTIQLLIEMRMQARADRNFTLSDQIRNRLSELGVLLNDSKDRTTFSY